MIRVLLLGSVKNTLTYPRIYASSFRMQTRINIVTLGVRDLTRARKMLARRSSRPRRMFSGAVIAATSRILKDMSGRSPGIRTSRFAPTVQSICRLRSSKCRPVRELQRAGPGGFKYAGKKDCQARAKSGAQRKGAIDAGRRVRPRRDAPYPRRKAWCALDEAGRCDRAFESQACGRAAGTSWPPFALIRIVETDQAGEENFGNALARDHRRAETRASFSGFAPQSRETGASFSASARTDGAPSGCAACRENQRINRAAQSRAEGCQDTETRLNCDSKSSSLFSAPCGGGSRPGRARSAPWRLSPSSCTRR